MFPGRPAIVFWTAMQAAKPKLSSWVFHPPLPGPQFDDQVLWLLSSDQNAEVLAAFPGRTALELDWTPDGRPRVIPYVPH